MILNPDGSFTYTHPHAGFKGDDTFQSLLRNDSFVLDALSNIVTVSIHVS